MLLNLIGEAKGKGQGNRKNSPPRKGVRITGGAFRVLDRIQLQPQMDPPVFRFRRAEQFKLSFRHLSESVIGLRRHPAKAIRQRIAKGLSLSLDLLNGRLVHHDALGKLVLAHSHRFQRLIRIRLLLDKAGSR